MAEPAFQHRSLEAWRRSLVTPEGVDLSLRLADMGQRFTAFLLDLLIMVGLLIALSLLIAGLIAATGMAGIEIAAIVWLLGFFLLRNFYFVLMEMGPRAATFGKRATGLRVVARSGERLTADRVIARNMMREIEFYLPISFLAYTGADVLTALAGLVWTGIFLFFPYFNKDRMRIGDLLAGTWVVNAPRRKLTVDLARADEGALDYGFTNAQLDVYGVFEIQTLEQVLRDNRPEGLATVAEAIRGKLGLPHDGSSDLGFLTAYYTAARARMERGLLFGKRRADKFDKSV
ncbi:MAG TPA: RDD family protein [Allosphingosinicella sp.]|nr:RDD family protein [Allosphingosinicella sp.]